jgi:predicted Zn-dependent peptidase
LNPITNLATIARPAASRRFRLLACRMMAACGFALCALSIAAADSLVPKDVTLPNGIRLIIKQESASELVAVHVFIRAGANEEDEQTSGIGSFVAATLFTGTKNQRPDSIRYMTNALGGNVGAAWDTDFTQLHALTLASNFEDASFMISDVLKFANFPDSEVEKSRKDLLSAFQSRSDDLFTQVYDNMRHTLYAGTSLDRSLNGDPEVIKRLTADDLRRYYAKYYVPRNIVISVVGNVAPERVETSFRNNLADFPRVSSRRPVAIPLTGPTLLDKPVVTKKFRGDLNGAYTLFGFLAPGVGSHDYPAVVVTNALLGGMKTSKLFTTIREKQGLGYEVSSIYPAQVAWSDLSAFVVSAAKKEGPDGKPMDMAPLVRDALTDSIKSFRETKPSEEDLARAKRYLIGSYLIAHERIERRAFFLGFTEIAQKELGGYQFDTHYADYINAVTAADVQRVAKQYLGNGAVISMILPGDPNAGVISK